MRQGHDAPRTRPDGPRFGDAVAERHDADTAERQRHSADAPTRLDHVPALDGLRGLAVAGVLLFHGGLSWAVGGYLGVSLFFTLSGFLITSLLLAEHQATRSIALRGFWARRMRRLLPAALVTVAGVVAYVRFAGDNAQLRSLRGDVVGSLAYVANWRFVTDGHGYADLFQEPSPIQHFWSLAIEEQFYVLFPLAVVGLLAIGRRRLAVLAAALAVAIAASTALSIALAPAAGGDTARVYYGTDTRMAELLIGALLAVAITMTARRRSAGIPHHRRALALQVGGFAALGALLFMWASVDQHQGWLFRGGLAGHAALAAVVIAAVRHPGALASGLSVSPLRTLGRISYGVYLYHWPLFLWLTPERTGLDGASLFALRVGTTLVVATISYHVLEMPIRTGRRLGGAIQGIATPIAAGAAVLALAVAATLTLPPPSVVLASVTEIPDPLLAPRADAAPPSATATLTDPERPAPTRSSSIPDAVDSAVPRPLPDDRPVRALVVGDSVALSLGRGMERWALERPDAEVANAARLYCSVGRFAERNIVANNASGEGCDDWHRRWRAHVDFFDPDVVVVLSTVWELVERRRDVWDEFLAPGDPRYDSWLHAEYDAAVDVLSARGARVVWLTIPCMGDEDESMRNRTALVNSAILPALADGRPEVDVVDLHGRVCPGGEFSNELSGTADARPDGLHFSDPGADAAARWLMPQLVSAAHPPSGAS